MESQRLACQSPVEVPENIQLGHTVRKLEFMIFIDAVYLVDLWLLGLDLEARIASIEIFRFDLLYFFFN